MVPYAIRNILERSRIENCIRLFAENAHCLMPKARLKPAQTPKITENLDSTWYFCVASKKMYRPNSVFFFSSRSPADNAKTNAMRTLEQKNSPRHFSFVIFVCAFSKLNIWHYSTLWVWNWIHRESFEHKFNADFSDFLNRERTNREQGKIKLRDKIIENIATNLLLTIGQSDCTFIWIYRVQ